MNLFTHLLHSLCSFRSLERCWHRFSWVDRSLYTLISVLEVLQAEGSNNLSMIDSCYNGSEGVAADRLLPQENQPGWSIWENFLTCRQRCECNWEVQRSFWFWLCISLEPWEAGLPSVQCCCDQTKSSKPAKSRSGDWYCWRFQQQRECLCSLESFFLF